MRLGRCFHFLSPRPEKQLMFLATMSWEIAKTRLGFPSGLCLPTAVPNPPLLQPRQLQMLADMHRCESLLAQISGLWILVKAVIIPTECCDHLHSSDRQYFCVPLLSLLQSYFPEISLKLLAAEISQTAVMECICVGCSEGTVGYPRVQGKGCSMFLCPIPPSAQHWFNFSTSILSQPREQRETDDAGKV